MSLGKFLFVLLCISMLATNCSCSKKETWEEWVNKKAVSGYFQQLDSLRIEEEKILSIQNGLQESDRYDESVSALREFGFETQRRLEKLQPPEELQAYHNEEIKIFEYGNLASVSMLNRDVERAVQYTIKMYEASIRAEEELKSICRVHNAPEEVIMKFNKNIAASKESLRQIKGNY